MRLEVDDRWSQRQGQRSVPATCGTNWLGPTVTPGGTLLEVLNQSLDGYVDHSLEFLSWAVTGTLPEGLKILFDEVEKWGTGVRIRECSPLEASDTRTSPGAPTGTVTAHQDVASVLDAPPADWDLHQAPERKGEGVLNASR